MNTSRSLSAFLAMGLAFSGAGVATAGLHDSDADFYGRTGDVMAINLAAVFGGSSFSGLTFNGAGGFDVPSTTNWTGNSFSSTGQFFLIPDVDGGSSNDLNINAKGFQGTLQGNVTVDGVLKSFEVTVREGYTGNGRGMVVDAGDTVSVAGQQHRLNYLGYPTKGGSSLVVDGDYGPASTKAVQLFQASFGNSKPSYMDGVVGPNTTKWLNSANAPQWVELVDPDPQTGYFDPYDGNGNFDILPGTDPGGGRSGATPQPERWATNWAVETIKAASAAVSGTQVINGMSTDDGWGSSKWHQTHQAGMDIDLNVPGSVMNYGNGYLSSSEQGVVNEMVAFVQNAAEGCEIYKLIISNTDVRDAFNDKMDDLGLSAYAVGDSSGVHLNHVHMDLRTTGATTMTADAAGDFDISGGIDAFDIDLLYKNLGGDASIFNLAATSTLVTQKDVDYLVRDILDTQYGDADLDGDVDFGDFSALMDNFTGELGLREGSEGWATGDWDGDWDVDAADLAMFDLYQTAGFNASQQAVYDDFVATMIPEPLSGSLMILGGLGLLMRRRNA
ncbi:peptidoglycan-binding protein [Planctomycetota bacterium]|nr:peptidoglycan-binding protein [Planctomycetota bacterium]